MKTEQEKTQRLASNDKGEADLFPSSSQPINKNRSTVFEAALDAVERMDLKETN